MNQNYIINSGYSYKGINTIDLRTSSINEC